MSNIVIDDNLRTMTIPTDIKLLGVESDDDVNKIPFIMPKEYCGTDLSTFEARINYMNAKGEGDLYVVEDLEVDVEDPTKMTFTWVVGRNACKYEGNTRFIVCLKKFADDESGTVLQEFNTTVYQLPVLKGLETVEAVVQNNADIIEQILQRIDDSGMFDPTQYYTKTQVDNLIPTELPNPYALTVNGQQYDGSEAVEVDLTTIATLNVSGKLISVPDAVPEAVQDLKLYDSGSSEISSAYIAVTNKNLFRSDLISDQVTSKGITFVKNEDGSITADGTSSDTDAVSSCNLDKYMFVIGNTYTLFSGKTAGEAGVQLDITYSDSSTDTIVSKNSPVTFTVGKEVASCVASAVVSASGVTVDDETVYPQLEVGDLATQYVMNSYEQILFDGSEMPILPDIISNIWANDASVANLVMTYEADTVYTKINSYVRNNFMRLF